MRARQREEEARIPVEEERSESMVVGVENLNIKTAGTEEEATEQLDAAIWVEIKEGGECEGEGEEGGEVTKRALGPLEFLTQYAEPIRTTLIDTRNGFNELSRLAMLWTVRHFWSAGVRFTFNCYRHWSQLLIRQPGKPLVPILSLEGVTQGYPLLMVLCASC